MSREDRVVRAREILLDSNIKQDICHKLIGTSHKDIENALKDIVQAPTQTKESEIRQELERVAPYKLNPDFNSKRRSTPIKMQYLLDRDEVNRLIAASNAPMEPVNTTIANTNYDTYTEAEVQALINCDYDPTKFKRRK